jgi:hypothetical protein
MAIDLANMRLLFRKPLGIDSTDMVDADVDLYLNRAYWEVMDKFPFREKERAGQFPTTAGIRNYEIPTPVEAVQGFAVVDPVTEQHIPLHQMKARETEFRYNENTFKQGIPQRYLLENCYVRFWPTPDKVYTIVIRKHTILSDIQATGIEIPQVWGEVIIYGAVWRAFIDFGDFTRMSAMKSIQHELISTITPREKKEIVDYQHAGIVPTSRDY